MKKKLGQGKDVSPNVPIVNLTAYRPTRKSIVLFGSVLGVLLLSIPLIMGGFFLQDDQVINGFSVALLLGSLFFVLDLVAYLCWSTAQQYLITSPVGIEYSGSGYNLRTSWNNLTAPGKVSYGAMSLKGVMARRATLEFSGVQKAGMTLMPIVQIIGALQGRYVASANYDDLGKGFPLTWFDSVWAKGESSLGATIRRYAPQVFNEPVPAGPVPAPDTFPPSLLPLIARPERMKIILSVLSILAAQVGLITVVIWWWNGGSSVKVLDTQEQYIESVTFSPNGKTIFVRGSELQLWQVPEGRLQKKVTGLPYLSTASLSSNGTLIALGGYHASTDVWTIADGQASLLQTLIPERDDDLAPQVSSIAFSPDDQAVAIGMDNGNLRIWSVQDGKILTTIQDNGETNAAQAFSLLGLYGQRDERSISDIEMASDGDSLAFLNDGYHATLCQIPTADCASLGADTYTMYMSMVFSPDKQSLVVGTYDGAIEVYSSSDRHLLFTLQGPDSPVNSLAFSSNGDLLAAGTGNGAIQLWNMKDHTRLRTLRGHGKSIDALSFSPDDHLLASGSEDETVRVWKIEIP